MKRIQIPALTEREDANAERGVGGDHPAEIIQQLVEEVER